MKWVREGGRPFTRNIIGKLKKARMLKCLKTFTTENRILEGVIIHDNALLN